MSAGEGGSGGSNPPPFNPRTYALGLPLMNGQYEAGIAAGGDLSIPDSQKLSVFPLGEGTDDDYAHRVQYQAYRSAIWALRKTEFRGLTDWYAKGAFCAVAFGMVGTIVKGGRRIPDGDYILHTRDMDSPPTKAEIEQVNALLDNSGFLGALTLQVAGKANFYQTNHHTGESMSKATGYTNKCMQVVLGGSSEDQVRMVHTISHWCSTIFVLKLAGVPRMRDDYLPIVERPMQFILTTDAKLRFSSFPAGTAKYAVVDQGIIKLRNHELARYFIDWQSLAHVREITRNLKLQGAAAHMGAPYLTDHDRYQYDESVVGTVLGRVGTFLRQFFPVSTLVKSPHFTIQAVESAEDYSPEWRDVCYAWAKAAKHALGNIEVPVQAALDAEQLARMRQALGNPEPEAEADLN